MEKDHKLGDSLDRRTLLSLSASTGSVIIAGCSEDQTQGNRDTTQNPDSTNNTPQDNTAIKNFGLSEYELPKYNLNNLCYYDDKLTRSEYNGLYTITEDMIVDTEAMSENIQNVIRYDGDGKAHTNIISFVTPRAAEYWLQSGSPEETREISGKGKWTFYEDDYTQIGFVRNGDIVLEARVEKELFSNARSVLIRQIRLGGSEVLFDGLDQVRFASKVYDNYRGFGPLELKPEEYDSKSLESPTDSEIKDLVEEIYFVEAGEIEKTKDGLPKAEVPNNQATQYEVSVDYDSRPTGWYSNSVTVVVFNSPKIAKRVASKIGKFRSAFHADNLWKFQKIGERDKVLACGSSTEQGYQKVECIRKNHNTGTPTEKTFVCISGNVITVPTYCTDLIGSEI